MNVLFRRFFTLTLGIIFIAEVYLLLRSFFPIASNLESGQFIIAYEEFEEREKNYKAKFQTEDFLTFLQRNRKTNNDEKLSQTSYVSTVSSLNFVNKKETIGHTEAAINTEVYTSKPVSHMTKVIEPQVRDHTHASLNVINQTRGLVDREINSELPNRGRINVYFYEDTCSFQSNYNLYWNALFPLFPSRSEFITSLEDEHFLENPITRRVTGYITPKETSEYIFKMEARNDCDFFLLDASTANTKPIMILRFGLFFDRNLTNIDFKLSDKLLEAISESPVLLLAGKAYLFDVIHSFESKGMFKIYWKTSKDETFISVPSDLLSPLDASGSLTPPDTNITYRTKSDREKLLEDNRKNIFFKIPTSEQSVNLLDCAYTNKSWMPNHVPDGYGTVFVQKDLIYPKDIMVENFVKVKDDYEKFLKKEKADRIVNHYMKLLPGNFTLQHIVHLEENKEDKQGKRYFIELDITDENDKLQRVSQWIIVKSNGDTCHPKGYTWNSRDKIYLLTPVKNQRKWIEYLVKSINDICTVTKDHMLHLVIVDYNSTDVHVENILKKLLIPYTYIHKEGSFNKVEGLNIAVKSIQETDPILFVLDLQLQIPFFIFDYIRKHTFKSQTTYVPILLRCGCGQHPAHTTMELSLWQEIGYGMIALYKSDWNKIGGMNEKKFGKKWGGEDWDLVEKLIIEKIEVIHHRIPGYYHLYHTTKGTWDGTKLF